MSRSVRLQISARDSNSKTIALGKSTTRQELAIAKPDQAIDPMKDPEIEIEDYKTIVDYVRGRDGDNANAQKTTAFLAVEWHFMLFMKNWHVA